MRRSPLTALPHPVPAPGRVPARCTRPPRLFLLSLALPLCGGLLGTASAQDTPPAATTEPAPAADTPSPPATPAAPADSASSSSSASALPSAAAIEEASMGKAKQKARGFAVYLTVGGRYLLATPDSATTLASTAFQGGLFAGYKLDRIVVGLGFDISHLGTATKYASGTSEASGTRGDTAFLLGPGIQAAILRSPDQRIEMVGAFQIGFGRTFTSRGSDPAIPPQYGPETNTSNFRLAYQIGPALRYWAHPQFALTVGSGISGDHLFFTQNNPSGNKADQVNSISLYGTLGALGVF